MKLSNSYLRAFASQHLEKRKLLKEKVLQFGTGVLLRGLVDYYFDYANKADVYDGSVVVVQSTQSGDLLPFELQNNIYTIITQGVSEGVLINNHNIVTCVSRVLNAKEEWDTILSLAKSPDIEIIVSNTTELGIIEKEEALNEKVPSTFPRKLTTFLYERFLAFNGSKQSGLFILPTELIEGNAVKLKGIVNLLIEKYGLGEMFQDWVNQHNYFCETLVDRIVPGAIELDPSIGYEDNLAINVEPYNLWAIATSEKLVQDRLSFLSINKGVHIVKDISLFKELKIRLLNAAHIIMCPIAILSKHIYVRDTFLEDIYVKWCHDFMEDEIKPYLLLKGISSEAIDKFGQETIDRFKNPYINHYWKSISQNYITKWIERVVPIFDKFEFKYNRFPQRIAFSLACLIRAHEIPDIEFFHDPKLVKLLKKDKINIEHILSCASIWGIDLTTHTEFKNQVVDFYRKIVNENENRDILNIYFS